MRTLKAVVRESQPDVIINFFEPLTGIYALTCRNRPPVVAVAHQFMYEHPAYVRAPGKRMQQFGMKWYVRMVGAASTRVALSLYEAPDLPEKNLVVVPPILRRQLFELQPNPDGNFVLVYLLNHGYAEQIIALAQKKSANHAALFLRQTGRAAGIAPRRHAHVSPPRRRKISAHDGGMQIRRLHRRF